MRSMCPSWRAPIVDTSATEGLAPPTAARIPRLGQACTQVIDGADHPSIVASGQVAARRHAVGERLVDRRTHERRQEPPADCRRRCPPAVPSPAGRSSARTPWPSRSPRHTRGGRHRRRRPARIPSRRRAPARSAAPAAGAVTAAQRLGELAEVDRGAGERDRRDGSPAGSRPRRSRRGEHRRAEDGRRCAARADPAARPRPRPDRHEPGELVVRAPRGARARCGATTSRRSSTGTPGRIASTRSSSRPARDADDRVARTGERGTEHRADPARADDPDAEASVATRCSSLTRRSTDRAASGAASRRPAVGRPPMAAVGDAGGRCSSRGIGEEPIRGILSIAERASRSRPVTVCACTAARRSARSSGP